jgi:hypothetical protein
LDATVQLFFGYISYVSGGEKDFLLFYLPATGTGRTKSILIFILFFVTIAGDKLSV